MVIWSIGVLEYWNLMILFSIQYSSMGEPFAHFSITPCLRIVCLKDMFAVYYYKFLYRTQVINNNHLSANKFAGTGNSAYSN